MTICPFCLKEFEDRCSCGAYLVDGKFAELRFANEQKKRVVKKVCKGGVEDGF